MATSTSPCGPFVPYNYPAGTQYPKTNSIDPDTGILNEPYTENHRPFVGQIYIPGSYSIDPVVIIEDDGSAYMLFGGNQYGGINGQIANTSVSDGDKIPFDIGSVPRIVRLKDNMTEFAYVPREIHIVDKNALNNDDNYYEGPWIHKRYNPGDSTNYYYLS